MRGFLLKGAIAFTAIFGFFVYFSWNVIFLSFKDGVDLYGEDFNIIEHGEGGRIVADIDLSLGECVSETTEYTKNGRKTSSSTDYYYVVPVWVGEEDTYYVCVQVDQKDRSLYNKITNQTYDYLDGKDISSSYVTASFDGTIDELDDELYDYMLEWAREGEMFDSETEMRTHMLQLYLQPINFDSSTQYIIVNIVLLAIAVLFWILFFVKGRTVRPANANADNSYNVNTNMPQYSPDPYNNQFINDNNAYNGQYNNNGYNAPSNNGTYNTQNNNDLYNASYNNTNNTQMFNNTQNTQNNQFNGQ